MVKLDDTSLPRLSFYLSNWGRLRKQNIKHAKPGSAFASKQRTMKFEQAAKHFRQKVAPLGAGQIIIVTNDGDFSGRGRISAVDGKLELAVILDGERELPRIRGSTTRNQFWKIGCTIEEQVPVWTVDMPDQWNTHEALLTFHLPINDFSSTGIIDGPRP